MATAILVIEDSLDKPGALEIKVIKQLTVAETEAGMAVEDSFAVKHCLVLEEQLMSIIHHVRNSGVVVRDCNEVSPCLH